MNLKTYKKQYKKELEENKIDNQTIELIYNSFDELPNVADVMNALQVKPIDQELEVLVNLTTVKLGEYEKDDIVYCVYLTGD